MHLALGWKIWLGITEPPPPVSGCSHFWGGIWGLPHPHPSAARWQRQSHGQLLAGLFLPHLGVGEESRWVDMLATKLLHF